MLSTEQQLNSDLCRANHCTAAELSERWARYELLQQELDERWIRFAPPSDVTSTPAPPSD